MLEVVLANTDNLARTQQRSHELHCGVWVDSVSRSLLQGLLTQGQGALAGL